MGEGDQEKFTTKVSDAVRESVQGQKPGWKNVLSRAVADKLSPQTPILDDSPFPDEEVEIPEEHVVEAKKEPTQEEQLKEKSRQVIEKLDRINQESLQNGNERLGYHIGEGEHEVFILAVPVEKDIIVRNEYDQRDDKIQYRHYVVFTREGIRTLWFNRGHIDGEGYLIGDDGNNDGRVLGKEPWGEEAILQNLLKKYVDNWEDQNGRLKRRTPETTSSGYTYEKVSADDGFVGFSKGPKIEALNLGSTESWISGDRGWYGVAAEVSSEMVQEALEESKKAAKVIKEIPQTPTGQQIETLDKVLEDLEV